MPRVPATHLVDCVIVDSRGGRLTQRAELALPGGQRERVRVRRLSAGTGLAQPVAARFLDTCALAELVGSPHVDRVLGYDAAERPYVATASVDAVTLAAATHGEAGGLDPAVAALVGEDIARGLAAAHALTPPLIHDALDMESVLITPDGRALVTDYGFGRLTLGLRELRKEDARYFSPERVADQPTTGASDLFSLGAILYETITGVIAFAGDNLIATRILIQTGRVEPVTTLRPSTPAPLADLVHSLLAVRPQDRPSASQVAGTLAMLSDRSGRARTELARLASSPADARSTTAHGPDLVNYARSLVNQRAEERSTIPEPEPAPAFAPAPEPYAPLTVEPTRVEPGLATPAPVHASPEPTDLPVPRTMVMDAFPQAPAGRAPTPAAGSPALPDPTSDPLTASGQHPLTASGAHPLTDSGSHPLSASGAHTYTPPAGYPTVTPSPTSSGHFVAAQPLAPTKRARSGVPAWLIWVLVAFGAFAVLGLVVGLAIVLAS